MINLEQAASTQLSNKPFHQHLPVLCKTHVPQSTVGIPLVAHRAVLGILMLS